MGHPSEHLFQDKMTPILRGDDLENLAKGGHPVEFLYSSEGLDYFRLEETNEVFAIPASEKFVFGVKY